MSIYLVRSLLLSFFIAIFVTTGYYMLREEVKSESIDQFKKSLHTWTASFTLEASPTAFAASGKAFKDAVDKNILETKARVQTAGYKYEIKLVNDNTYTVDISNVTDTVYIRNLVAANTRMLFCEVYTISDIAAGLVALADSTKEIFSGFILGQPYKDENGARKDPAYIGICTRADSGRIASFFSDPTVLSKFPEDIRFLFGEPEQSNSGPDPYLMLYAVRVGPDVLSNKYISNAIAEFESNTPVIAFQFNASGAKRWERLTEKNIGRPVAICLDDKVIMAPNVIQAITGGSSRVSMKGNMETCRILSVLLVSEDFLLPVKITGSRITQENLSPVDKLSPLMKYALAFIVTFAISFSITWFVFKPGRNARSANP